MPSGALVSPGACGRCSRRRSRGPPPRKNHDAGQGTAMSANQVALWYLVAAVSFILALRGLSGPQTARRGNIYGMIGMAIALLVTLALVYSHSKNVLPILAAMVIGGAIGAVVARWVQVTQMP